MIGNNKIQAIPPEIFSSLTRLRVLQLYKNKIQLIPSEIGNLKGEPEFNLASHRGLNVNFSSGAVVGGVEQHQVFAGGARRVLESGGGARQQQRQA